MRMDLRDNHASECLHIQTIRDPVAPPTCYLVVPSYLLDAQETIQLDEGLYKSGDLAIR